MRIAFTGSHSTGKTTLVKHPYFERFNNYLVQESISRKYPKDWKDRDTQRKVNREYFSTHLLNKNLIAARSFYDPWAYSRINVDKSFMLWYFNICTYLIHYDFLFYLPIEFNVDDDNYRPVDKEYQKQVDREILSLLHKYQVKYYTISGSVAQRINTIDSIINPIGHLFWKLMHGF